MKNSYIKIVRDSLNKLKSNLAQERLVKLTKTNSEGKIKELEFAIRELEIVYNKFKKEIPTLKLSESDLSEKEKEDSIKKWEDVIKSTSNGRRFIETKNFFKNQINRSNNSELNKQINNKNLNK